MRIDGSAIRNGNSPNISISGEYFKYDMIHHSQNKVSFLVPIYDFERFIECTKSDENLIIYYLKGKDNLKKDPDSHWYYVEVTELKIFDKVWGNENHFDVTAFGVGKICVDSDIRDLRLSHLLK